MDIIMNHLRFSTLALLLAANLLLPGCSSDDTTPAGAGGDSAGGSAGGGGSAGSGGSTAGSGGAGASGKGGGGGSTAGSGGAGAGGAAGQGVNPAEVAGPADSHCAGTTPVVIDPKTCTSGAAGEAGAGGAGDAGAGGAGDAGAAGAGDAGAGGAGDAGAAGSGAGGDCQNTDSEYGDILYGSAAQDDDCKYSVTWSSSAAIVEGQSVTLSLTANYFADGKPVTGATPRAEIFFPCDLAHAPPAIDFNATATETSPGHYTIGPVQFDQSGHWAVRFHLFESCDDGPKSPHGHASFYVNVP
jgi:hypothetical protein